MAGVFVFKQVCQQVRRLAQLTLAVENADTTHSVLILLRNRGPVQLTGHTAARQGIYHKLGSPHLQ